MTKPLKRLHVGLHVGRSLRDRHSLIPLLGRHTFVRLPVPRRKRPAPELLYPLDYQRLDPRTLLAADASTSDEPPPLIFDLPPEVSATISALLGNQANYSSGIWRPAGDTASYPANQWSIAQDPTSFAPESWRNYSVNTNLPSGLTSSAFKATAPLDGGGYLVFIRQRQSNRSVGGGPAGGGIEGGGGGIPGNETVATSLTTTIVSVPTLAAANAINPLTFNPLLYSSRLSVTANHQFNYKDTTALGQIRSYTVNNSYQIGLSFVWGGQQTTTETDPASGGVTTRIVNYNSYGTVTLTGSHTFVGTLAVENSWLVEHGYLFGSNTSAVGLHSTNHVAANYVEGNLNGNSGFGATANGTSQANFHYTGTGTSAYVGTSHLYTYSGAQSGSLARQDTGTYSLQSAPQVSVSYTSRKDLAPSSGPELFGISNLNGPTGTNSSPPDYATQSLIANSSGTFSAQSPVQAHGYYGLQSTENVSYTGTKLNTATYAGFDYANSSGATFQSADSISYRFESPQRIALASIAFSASGSGGQISILDTDAMLELEDPPSIDPNEDVLTGAIISTGQLLEDTFELTTSLALGSRGVYSTRSSGSTPGSPETLVAGANAYLNDFTPLALHSPGTATSELNITAAPIASDDRATHYYWSAWSGESTSDSILSGPSSFNSQAEFGEAGDITLTQDGESGYLTTFSSTSRASEDGLSLFGTAPRVTRNNNWDLADPAAVAPYELRPENQSGNGGFIYIHFDSDNENAGHGSDSSSYDYTSILTPYANGQPTPNATLDNYSGTVAQTPNGLLITTGGSEVSAESVLDLDQADGIDKVIVAMWDRTGSAAGDHRFLSSLDIYEFDDQTSGSGGGSSSGSETLVERKRTSSGSSSGQHGAVSQGGGMLYSFAELDEAFTANSSNNSSSAPPQTGLLAGTDGLSRKLKYKTSRIAPLHSQASLNSDWNSDLEQATEDLLPGETPNEGDDPLAPPQYIVPLFGENDEVTAELSFSGGGSRGGVIERLFEEVGPKFSVEWDIEAWRDGVSDEAPASILRQGKLIAENEAPHADLAQQNNMSLGLSIGTSGIKLTADGMYQVTENISGGLTNPAPLIARETYRPISGGSRTEEQTIEPHDLRRSLSDETRLTYLADDFGAELTLAQTSDEGAGIAGWWLVPEVRGQGKLTSELHSEGTGQFDLTVTESETTIGLLGSLGGPSAALDSGVSRHTMALKDRPRWDTTDIWIREFNDDSSSSLAHNISGSYGRNLKLDTSGNHLHSFFVPDNGPSASSGSQVYRLQTGEYNSESETDLNVVRSGSSFRDFAPDGTLSSIEGQYELRSDYSGNAEAHDIESVKRTKQRGVTFGSLADLDASLRGGASGAGLFATPGESETGIETLTAERSYRRDSEDHFDTDLTETLTPSIGSDNKVTFARDKTFSSQFWGQLEESDTRSVQSSLSLDGWDGQYWFFDPKTVTITDSYPDNADPASRLTRTSSNGDSLDWGFLDSETYHSSNYRGELIDTSFSPLLAAGPQCNLAWDGSNDSPLGGGPSLLQESDVGGPDQIFIDRGNELAGLGLRIPGEAGRVPWNPEPPPEIVSENGIGIAIEISGRLFWAHYRVFPAHMVDSNIQGSRLVPESREFIEYLPITAFGAIGQMPGEEAQALYTTSHVLIGGGLIGAAFVPFGAASAVASGGLRGLFIYGASEIGSELTGLPIPTPGGAVRNGARKIAEAAVQSAAQLDNIVDVTKSFVKNAPASVANAKLNLLNPNVTPDPIRVLQNVTNQAVSQLAQNPAIARNLMSAGSYRHLVQGTNLADASYGKAVERLVADIVKKNSMLSSILQHQSRPFRSTPDFFGYEGYNLYLLDITTTKSVPSHIKARTGLRQTLLRILVYLKDRYFQND